MDFCPFCGAEELIEVQSDTVETVADGAASVSQQGEISSAIKEAPAVYVEEGAGGGSASLSDKLDDKLIEDRSRKDDVAGSAKSDYFAVGESGVRSVNFGGGETTWGQSVPESTVSVSNTPQVRSTLGAADSLSFSAEASAYKDLSKFTFSGNSVNQSKSAGEDTPPPSVVGRADIGTAGVQSSDAHGYIGERVGGGDSSESVAGDSGVDPVGFRSDEASSGSSAQESAISYGAFNSSPTRSTFDSAGGVDFRSYASEYKDLSEIAFTGNSVNRGSADRADISSPSVSGGSVEGVSGSLNGEARRYVGGKVDLSVEDGSAERDGTPATLDAGDAEIPPGVIFKGY